ncbi:unnamed protein product [Paramecium sonneborni]|uniref:Uncharacterized protein n=1 Tax=Paramecium sonneborni TaxID=65129 RepID=A0A8S1RD73_9CILI|nr:unnamed protein product [Paramecium sonneborni]
MDNTKLKREQFSILLREYQRSNKFQQNRKRLIQIHLEEQQINELISQTKIAIQKLADSLNYFDFDSPGFELQTMTNQVMNIVPEIKQCIENLSNIELSNFEGLLNKFWNVYCYLAFNKDNSCFLEMLELLTLFCQKSVLFCDTYCKSTLYINLQKIVPSFSLQYQLEFLKQTIEIQSHQEQNLLLYDKLCDIIKQMTTQIQEQKSLEFQNKKIIQIIIEIFLTAKIEKIDKAALQQQINTYFTTLFISLPTLDEILIGDELLNYIEYLNNNKTLFNSSTIELINQLSFNSNLNQYPDEKTMALGIIGVLISGNLTQSKYYFDKFSIPNLSLDQKLIQNLKQQPQVRRMTVFVLSNIFGEISYDKVDYFQNETAVQFLQYARQENDIEVLNEILQALRNLIYHIQDNYLHILLQYDVVSIIIDNENYILNQQQVQCLLMLIHRFNEYDSSTLQNLIQFPNFIQYLCFKGVANFVRKMFDNSKFDLAASQQLEIRKNNEYQNNLLKLCEILC